MTSCLRTSVRLSMARGIGTNRGVVFVVAPAICESKPCLNGGTCVTSNDGYSCNCLIGWTGVNCETRKRFSCCWNT